MNKKLRVQLNTYKRSLENRRVQSLIYSFFLVFILIVFDIIGLYSLYKITSRKLATYVDITKLNVDLNIKRIDSESLNSRLEESKLYLSRLDVAIPKEHQTEAFAVEIVEAAAKSGLKHRKFHRLTNTDEYVDVRITLQGPSSQIYPFIREVESMDRLTVVKSFDYVLDVDTAYLQVVIRVFYIER